MFRLIVTIKIQYLVLGSYAVYTPMFATINLNVHDTDHVHSSVNILEFVNIQKLLYFNKVLRY